MRYIEIYLDIRLKENVYYKKLAERLSIGINKYFLINDDLKRMHKENDFKLYSYGNLLPIENDKLYKKGKVYSLTLRFIKLDLLNDFYNSLVVIENDVFSVVSRRFDIIDKSQSNIKYLECITPAVITVNNKNLDIKNMDLELVKKRINTNSNKKYAKYCYGNNINHDFIEDIGVLNEKSIVFSYKTGIIIGNKYRVKIKEDEMSQNIAFITLATGMLEKNSLSFGFCKPIMEGEEVI